MTDVVTPTQISLDIGSRLGELDRLTADYQKAERAAVEARHAYKIARAKAYLEADGPIPERNAKADLAAGELLFTAEVEEAKVRMHRADIHRVEVHIDALRTSAATVRAELRTLDYGGGA